MFNFERNYIKLVLLLVSYAVLCSLSLLWNLKIKLRWLTVKVNSQDFAEFLHLHHQGVICRAASAVAV